MINDNINQRLEDLHNVLSYCTDQQNEGRIYVFKPGERICINQERAALLSELSYNFPNEIRVYKIPAAIEAKVKVTIEKIKATSYKAFERNQFFTGW